MRLPFLFMTSPAVDRRVGLCAEPAGTSDFAADIGTRVYWLAMLVGLVGRHRSRPASTVVVDHARATRDSVLAGGLDTTSALRTLVSWLTSARAALPGPWPIGSGRPTSWRADSRSRGGGRRVLGHRALAGPPFRARGGRQRRAGDRGRAAGRSRRCAGGVILRGQVPRRRHWHSAPASCSGGRADRADGRCGGARDRAAVPAAMTARPRHCWRPAPAPGSRRPSTRRSPACCSSSRSCAARRPTISRATTRS